MKLTRRRLLALSAVVVVGALVSGVGCVRVDARM